MKKLIRTVLASMGLLSSGEEVTDEIPQPKAALSQKFTVGQVWRYETRETEEGSRLLIGRIEELPGPTKIVHIKIVGLQLKNPHAPGGIATFMGHAPILESSLAESVVELVDEPVDRDGLEDGYQTWLAAYLEGEAGVFSIPVSEMVAGTEQTLSQ